MNEIEAIKFMKLFREEWDKNSKTENAKALDIAIWALEKQIPKKVQLRHIRKFDGFDDGECPACGGSVSRDCDGIDIFCLDCGQKLDWSDEE